MSLTVRNLVIVGDFIPSKFDKYYFLKNNIFNEEDILEQSVFVGEFCQLLTNKYSLLILPNQLVFNELIPQKDDALGKIMEQIASTSEFAASALGYNLHWYIHADNTKEIAKKYFYNENSALIKNFFDTADSNYGCYVSKDFGKARLKLDIKPNILKHPVTGEENILVFAFNFHYDLNEVNFKVEILSILKELNSYNNEAEKIMSIYE